MDNLGWGLTMTALGMGLVFGLLALLWGLLEIAGRLDRPAPAAGAATAPADVEAAQVAARPAPAPAATELTPDLVAAITIAALAHKAVLRLEAAPLMRIRKPGSLLHISRWLAAGRNRQNYSWQRRR
jgi:glutaconyl-CoA/methylmalonyl-CoA decarboxylase subunit delta